MHRIGERSLVFSRTPVLNQFWEPFVKSSEPVLFCLADQSQYSTIRLRDAQDPQREITLNDRMVTIIIDEREPLGEHRGPAANVRQDLPRASGEISTSLTDLRRGPTVFIGAFDNGWTLRLYVSAPSLMTKMWIGARPFRGLPHVLPRAGVTPHPFRRHPCCERNQTKGEDPFRGI